MFFCILVYKLFLLWIFFSFPQSIYLHKHECMIVVKCSCDQLSFTKHIRYCSAWMIMRQGINTFLPARQHSALCHVSLWHVSLLCFVLLFFSLRLLFTHLGAWNEDFCDADISKKLRVPSHGSYHKPFLWSVKSQMLREGPVIYWLMSWKF